MEQRRTAGGWYLVGIGLIGSALAIALTGFMQMHDTVASFQRVVVPGTAEVTLAPGRTTLYAEHRSIVNATEYTLAGEPELECTLQLERRLLGLRAPHREASYSAGDFAGRAVYEFDVDAPGTYTLTCTAERPLVVAIGGGIGAWFVVALVGGLFPGLAGIVVVLLVFIRRRRVPPRPPAAAPAVS